MSRQVARDAVMMMPFSTVTSAVLLACGKPTWIRCPPIMIAPGGRTQ
jgi:hypothetical protein